MVTSRPIASAVLVALSAACSSSVELTHPIIHERAGPAAPRPMRRRVALPATCGTLSTVPVEGAKPGDPPVLELRPCPRDTLDGVDQVIRAALDFKGIEVVDSDKVNAVTAARREIQVRSKLRESRTITTEGALFEDATPFEQADILRELRADGILQTRIWVGAGVGFSRRRTITVQVRLVAAEGGALVWVRRCEIEIGGLLTDGRALETGAKCAAEGAPSQ